MLNLVMEVHLFMSKLQSSNKSPEYMYIYINIMRLLPSRCEPVLETCDTDIFRQ